MAATVACEHPRMWERNNNTGETVKKKGTLKRRDVQSLGHLAEARAAKLDRAINFERGIIFFFAR